LQPVKMTQEQYDRLTQGQQDRLRQAERQKQAAVGAMNQAPEKTRSVSSGQKSAPKQGSPKQGSAKPTSKRREEHDQQAVLFSRVYQWEKTYPVLILVHAVPNQRGGSEAGRIYMWAEGLRAGVLDVSVDASRVFRGTRFTGLKIEMKTPENEMSPKQVQQTEALVAEGFLVFVKRDGLEAWRLVCEYLGLPEKIWV
jgi:hypothetical protein